MRGNAQRFEIRMRYFIYFSYCGTRYHGYQIQPNALSVQEEMERALSTILRLPVSLVAAGRTDTGVHARMMVAHFDLPQEQETTSLVARLNSLLPPDIAAEKMVAVADSAHARFDALSRTYEYRVTLRKEPFDIGQVTRLYKKPDFDLMNEAAQHLLKVRDFASFCKAHSDNKTTICNVHRAFWQQQDEARWVFTIEADRFLRNMVRAIVGTLLEVGRGRMSIEEFIDIIEKHDRRAAGESMPPDGLYLTNICYPTAIFLHPSTE